MISTVQNTQEWRSPKSQFTKYSCWFEPLTIAYNRLWFVVHGWYPWKCQGSRLCSSVFFLLPVHHKLIYSLCPTCRQLPLWMSMDKRAAHIHLSSYVFLELCFLMGKLSLLQMTALGCFFQIPVKVLNKNKVMCRQLGRLYACLHQYPGPLAKTEMEVIS